jgi:hypothetical protein
LSQNKQKCGSFDFLATASLIRGCRNLVGLNFDCCNWKDCVANDIWIELPALPVPPREVIERGTQSVFQFVKAVLQGGSFDFFSCRVMVIGPQMVR